MKNLRKLEKSEVQNLFSVKGGIALGEKTTTEPCKTVERTNDQDSNIKIESVENCSVFSSVEP